MGRLRHRSARLSFPAPGPRDSHPPLFWAGGASEWLPIAFSIRIDPFLGRPRPLPGAARGKQGVAPALGATGTPREPALSSAPPRRPEDFGDGGAFPEIPVVQYPRNMGKPGAAAEGKTLALTVGADGGIGYDGIVKQGANV